MPLWATRMDHTNLNPTYQHALGMVTKLKKGCQFIYSDMPLGNQYFKYYNFLIFKATSQKAHEIRKKA